MAWEDFSRINFEEKMLWACVLRRAVFDFVLYRGVGKHKLRWQQANRFIFGEGDESYSGLSFDQICGLFGWDTDYFRRKVRELKRHDIKKLEASAFKECFDEGTARILTERAKWGTGQPVPHFIPYNYSKSYQLQMTLRSVQGEPEFPKRLKSITLVSRWAMTAA